MPPSLTKFESVDDRSINMLVVNESLDDLTNFVGIQWDGRANCAILGLNATGVGFKVASECLRDLMQTFSGNSFDDSNCGLMTRVLQKLCNTNNTNEMTPDRCGGFKVCPPEILYPLAPDDEEITRFFTSTEDTAEMMRKINAARMIHVWTPTTEDEEEVVRKGAPYAQIAEKYCPIIYRLSGGEF